MRENNFKRIRLGELLLKRNLINEQQLKEAVEEQKKNGTRIGESLVKLGHLKEEELLSIFSESLKMEVKNIEEIDRDEEVVKSVKEDLIRKYKFFPYKIEGNTLFILVNDPYNIVMEEEIKMTTSKNIKMNLAREKDIEKLIKETFEKIKNKEEKESIEEEFEGMGEDLDNDMFDVTQNENASTVVKLVNKIIQDAYEMRASDIHIEPTEKKLIIRQRIDGVLFLAKEFPKTVHQTVTARLKVMAQMDIAEKRKPQDGRIQLTINNKKIDARIAVIPTINGEKSVIRILDRENIDLNIESLGLSEIQLPKLKRIVEQPNGVVLVTGPTGSGKTSTLYTILNEINTVEKNIITVEDPVEYKLEGINQINVNEAGKLTFPKALKAILRQDPDIIMIGEIRDNETAEISAKAATTGHKVYATLHTDKSVDAIARLLSMEVPSYLIATTVRGVITQRLVRRLCETCKEKYVVSEDDINKMIFPIKDGEEFYRATGKDIEGKKCKECNGVGYKGRMPIHEILELDGELRQIISAGEFDYTFEQKAKNKGLQTLTMDGLYKARKGHTSVEELKRIVEATFDEEESK